MLVRLCNKSSKLLQAPLNPSPPVTPTQSSPFINFLPSRLLHSTAQPASSLHLKLYLLLHENFSSAQLKLLQENRYFLAASFDRVSYTVSFLQAKDVSGSLASKLLTRYPSILAFRPELLQEKCKFLQDLGINPVGLQKILTNRFTRALLRSATETLRKRIDFLQRVGLKEQDILKVVTSYPGVLCASTNNKMEATLALLDRHGLRKVDFATLVRFRPQVFLYSVGRKLTDLLEFLRGLGIKLNSRAAVRAIAGWISVSRRRLLSGWTFLRSQGFSQADIHKMVQRQPAVLLCNEDAVVCKLGYLKDVLNRDRQDVVNWPCYLCLSFEKRIVPRFTFVTETKMRDTRAKSYSLPYVLGPSDKLFERRYGSNYGEWKAEYLKKQAGGI